MNYFVYMLRCADDSFYIGVTNDAERRLAQHNAGWDPDAYTHTRRPCTLVYIADFQRIEQAIGWEKQIKGWSRAKKQALIDANWNRIHLLSRNTLRQGRR
jgi:putative endonuclease